MDDSAQNSNVNDIWSSLSGKPAQPNANDDQNQPVSSVSTSSGGGFRKPGVTSGESDGKWETNTTAEESLAKARKEEAERLYEIIKPTEKLPSPENVETQKHQKESPKHTVHKTITIQPIEEPSLKGKIVDKRAGHEVTHRVDLSADDVTKKADLEEQDFIEEVERQHEKVSSIV